MISFAKIFSVGRFWVHALIDSIVTPIIITTKIPPAPPTHEHNAHEFAVLDNYLDTQNDCTIATLWDDKYP